MVQSRWRDHTERHGRVYATLPSMGAAVFRGEFQAERLDLTEERALMDAQIPRCRNAIVSVALQGIHDGLRFERL